MHKYYPACLYANPDTEALTVVFPDLPGCISQGDNLDQAIDNAVEALELYLDEAVRAGQRLPSATPLAKLKPGKLAADCPFVAVQLIPLALPTIWKRYTATMPAHLLERIDRQASSWGMNRSGFLAEASRRFLSENSGNGASL